MMFKKILLFILLFSLFTFNSVFSATKEDVILAINKTYSVGEETYRLPQNIIDKGEKYLNKNPLTSTQYDNILRCIDNAVALAREVGTTDIKKVSKEDLKRALAILLEASRSANVDLNKELTENNITFPIDNETHNNNNEQSSDKSQSSDKNQNNYLNVEEPPKKDESFSETVSNIDLPNNSGDNDSGEVSSQIPEGSNLPDNIASGDNSVIQNSSKDDTSNVDNKVERNIKIVLFVLIIILFVLFLIIYLILKSKWNKLVKYVLMIIFVTLFILIFATLLLSLYCMEEIKLIYKLYYMFK